MSMFTLAISCLTTSNLPWFMELKWQPTPVLLPGKSHGQRSLIGYSPWGHKELDMTEWLHFLSLFMDLTFQVQMQYCSLQHWTLLPSPITSTTGLCFLFGFVSSFFLELFLHSTLIAYWVPTDLGSSFFSVLSFPLFILFMGFSGQEHWSSLPFPSPVDHVCQNSPPWPVRLEGPTPAAWKLILLSLCNISHEISHMVNIK